MAGTLSKLKIIDHKGFNLAIWNAHNYMIRVKNNIVMIDDDPLVFYHFASTQAFAGRHRECSVLPRGGRSKPC